MKDMKEREQIVNYLHANGIASVFNDQIMPHLSLYSFDQGELICSQGEPLQYLYILVKGKVKIYTTSAEGKTLILSFKTPLEMIGDIEYVQETDIINTVEAVSSVCMIGIHHRWLKKYASNDSALLQFLLKIITQKFYIKSFSLSFSLMYPVEVRLASYLLSVSFDESDSLFDGKLSIDSLKESANLIGTSSRHLNRVIKQFCTEGLVERSKEFIQIKDREGLRALTNGNIYE